MREESKCMVYDSDKCFLLKSIIIFSIIVLFYLFFHICVFLALVMASSLLRL